MTFINLRPTVTLIIIVTCIVVTAIFYRYQSADHILFLYISEHYGRDLSEVYSGQWWRLVTPIFVHLDIYHLIFNIGAFWYIGNLLESFLGWKRYLVFVLAVAVATNMAQLIYGGANFGGLSGLLYAMLSYLWGMGYFAKIKEFAMPPFLLVLLLVYFAASWSGVLGQMSNMSHTVGLLSGIVIAYTHAFLIRTRSN